MSRLEKTNLRIRRLEYLRFTCDGQLAMMELYSQLFTFSLLTVVLLFPFLFLFLVSGVFRTRIPFFFS